MSLTCWGITGGSAGMIAQVEALASVLDVTLEMKSVRVKSPWVKLPNVFYGTVLKSLVLSSLIEQDSDKIEEPWPDVIISCGRRGAIVNAALRRKILSQNKDVYSIHIQDPQMSPKNFDLVIAMAHDKVEADNVIKTSSALHRITDELLDEAKQKWESDFAHYPSPRVAVLLGGSTNKYTVKSEAIDRVIVVLERLLRNMDGSLLITPSRRTGDENIERLRVAFEKNDRVYMYDMEGENPYYGMLALADTFVVTNDSVNMMSEAAATGKPIHMLRFAKHKGTKPSRFAQRMVYDGIARPLGTRLEFWEYEVKDTMQALAKMVKEHMAIVSSK